jgi:molybdate transport system ATP-binding protein
MDAVAFAMKALALHARVRKEFAAGGPHRFALDVSMEALPGITILFGASGAGKTTFLDCLAGLVRPDDGHIAIGDAILFDAATRTDLPPQRRQIAYVFQTLALFPHLNVEQNVAYGLKGLSAVERCARTREILDSFHIAHLGGRRPEEISGGERQRAALARSLVASPRLLLLDEPLSGLDAVTKSALISDLRAWNAAHEIPVLYVTHSRGEVFALGERVIALESGRVVVQGTPQEVLEAPRLERMAQLAGFENLFDAHVLELHEALGTMLAQIDGSAAALEVPLGHAKPGASVRLAIRAGDILLASEAPRGLSARNILSGTIVALEPRGMLVEATVDCGARFVAHVTPGACQSLSLAPGQRAWLIVKTHSCHLV